jgi:hypothetical protein
VPGCRAGRSFFNVDSAGGVSICVERRSEAVGNLFTDPMQAIRRELLATSRDNGCTGCWYNCRGEIESLYGVRSLIESLPTLLFDRGKAPPKGAARARSVYLPPRDKDESAASGPQR